MSTYDELLELEQGKDSPTPTTPEKATGHEQKATPKATQKITRPRQLSRQLSSMKSRSKSRETSRSKASSNSLALPTRNEIQEFSFRLRDELKSKVQAEVPHQWPKELEEIARQLNVKKLELYRFILGEFLGKVKRKVSV